MNQNQNRKTLRHFQCRDFLWEIFEQMSAELECSIDYLINEAMRQYARARNYSPRQVVGPQSETAMPAATRTTRPVGPTPHAITTPNARPPRPPLSPRPGPPPPLPSARPRPPQPLRPGGHLAGTGSIPTPGMSPGPMPSYSQAGTPQIPSGDIPPGTPRLYLIFNGRKIPVTKEQFIIGRGSKTSDLPIKDGNISRKHAAIILHSGVYYLKDLGSTNGIEYNGMRIDNKRIEEGDIFHICDYELRFTYR